MTPHAGGAAPAPPRETAIPRRLSFRRSLRESGLPGDYLEALDAKRRQLDDSIWKYIASKEREYKNYERELKHQRRASQGQEGNGGRRGKASPETAVEEASVKEKDVGVVDGVEGKGAGKARERRETMDRGSIAGLKDRRASLERDKDFVGVFTPSYLTALSDESQQGPAILERTSSNPDELLHGTTPPAAVSLARAERTNSDSIVHTKKPTRPSQLVLQHRTSSSGSSADGRLTSAMKSPTQRPKRKRVSLAVGDAIVAPSDNVPVSLTGGHSTPSHSRIRQAFIPAAAAAAQEQADTTSAAPRTAEPTWQGQNSTSVAAAIMEAEQRAVADAKTHHDNETEAYAVAAVERNDFAAMPGASPSTSSKIDPDGDLFDLEEENEAALPPPILDSDDVDEAIEDEEEEDELPAPVDSASTSATSNPIFTPSPGERYDPNTGIIPEPEGEPDSAVPYLPSSAQTSQMPSKPGFRRPSVINDPVFKGSGYRAAEHEAVLEDESYGSSFVRPNKGSFTSGSLGESFMEKNAEQMMKLREERQQRTAQVRS